MGKPRKFSPESKARVALEIGSGRTSLAEPSRAYQIKDSLLHR